MVLHPGFQELISVGSHETQDALQLRFRETEVPSKLNRIKPDLRGSVVAIDVHVCRLTRFVAIEVESIRTASENRRHRCR